VYVGRFLLPFERFIRSDSKKTSSNAAKAVVVGSKRRRPILNGDSSRHGPVLKKKKKKIIEPSLDSAFTVEDKNPSVVKHVDDTEVDHGSSLEFETDQKTLCTSPSIADDDLKADVQRLDDAAQPTASVRFVFRGLYELISS